MDNIRFPANYKIRLGVMSEEARRTRPTAVFLFNSGDRKTVEALFKGIAPTLTQHGLVPFIDNEMTGLQSNHVQIQNAISRASLILWFVGRSGPGVYQSKVENGYVVDRDADAKSVDDIVSIRPVILPGTTAREWNTDDRWEGTIRNRAAINADGRLGVDDLVRAILTLVGKDLNWAVTQPNATTPGLMRVWRRSRATQLAQELRDPESPGLCLIIGPYALAGQNTPLPQALAERLYNDLEVPDQLPSLWFDAPALLMRAMGGVPDDRVIELVNGHAQRSPLLADLSTLSRSWCEAALPAEKKLIFLSCQFDTVIEEHLQAQDIHHAVFEAVRTDGQGVREFTRTWPLPADLEPSTLQSAHGMLAGTVNEPVVVLKLCGQVGRKLLILTADETVAAADKFSRLPLPLPRILQVDGAIVLLGGGLLTPMIGALRVALQLGGPKARRMLRVDQPGRDGRAIFGDRHRDLEETMIMIATASGPDSRRELERRFSIDLVEAAPSAFVQELAGALRA
jgi:hypothetical protein